MTATVAKTPSLSQTAVGAVAGDDWREAMRAAVTDVDTLFALLDLPRAALPGARRAARLFGLRVPHGYVARMTPGDLHDPLLRQVLPLDAEHARPPGFSADAVGDHASGLGDGVLHKYHGRALLITTGACAVHCRYCFRRHFDYAAHHAGADRGRAALERIAADASLQEIILSGGDPLSLSNARLSAIGRGLDTIEHITRLRLHTRTAVVLPERIDAGLLDWIAARRARVIVVVHANHAREIDARVENALAQISQAGATILNQAVLLRGINDNAQALVDLSERLFECGVMPYYLHLLDRVLGAAHFEVHDAAAIRLHAALAARLPGYLVPRLAREMPGEAAKQVLA